MGVPTQPTSVRETERERENELARRRATGEGGLLSIPDTPSKLMMLCVDQARVHIMSRSMKAAKREVKSALNLSNQNVTALFLKGNFEYVRYVL